jgi:hypothetical protein
MICHIMGQRLFLGQMRLGLLLSSTNATTYWQKRAGILDKRQQDVGIFPGKDGKRQVYLPVGIRKAVVARSH